MMKGKIVNVDSQTLPKVSPAIRIGALVACILMVLVCFSPWVLDQYKNDTPWVGSSPSNDEFYLYDLLQMEDYIDCSPNNVEDYQEFVDLETDLVADSFVTTQFGAWGGTYSFLFKGTGTAEIGGQINAETAKGIDDSYWVLLKSLEVSILHPGVTVIDEASISMGYDYLRYERLDDNQGDIGHVYTRVWWYYGEFTLLPYLGVIVPPPPAPPVPVPEEYDVKIRLSVKNDEWNTIENECPLPITIFKVKIQTDVAIIERFGLTDSQGSVSNDCDGDLIPNDQEFLQKSCAYKEDVDQDGMSDQMEYTHLTDPLNRDTDRDGIRDSVELSIPPVMLTCLDSKGSFFERIGSNQNPAKANFPPVDQNNNYLNISNVDLDTSTSTNPLDWDSDGDGLADGCIDGIQYRCLERDWVRTADHDGIHQRWEGEDLNGDGLCDRAINNQANSRTHLLETEPDDSKDFDGDDMYDGWEAWFSLDPLDATGIDGADGNVDGQIAEDSDNDGVLDTFHDYEGPSGFVNAIWVQSTTNTDGLKNIDEFVLGTNPRKDDTDQDQLKDDIECDYVILRTNVEEGAFSADHYGQPTDWIWFIGTSTDPDQLYTYVDTTSNQLPIKTYALFGYEVSDHINHDLVHIHAFDERSWIYRDGDFMYVCRVEKSQLAVIESMTVHKYMRQPGPAGQLSEIDPDYPFSQITLLNPLRTHTDGIHFNNRVEFESAGYHALSDGLASEMSEVEYDEDWDQDGIINARDIDSDGDGIQDPFENIDFTDPDSRYDDFDNDNVWNIKDTDADDDSLHDCIEIEKRTRKQWAVSSYYEHLTASNYQRHELMHVTFCDPYHPDSDGDGLIDGPDLTFYTGNTCNPENGNRIAYLTTSEFNLDFTEVDLSAEDGGGKKYTFNGEGSNTLPDCPDSDGDGLWDGNTQKSRLDGIVHLGELTFLTSGSLTDSDGDGLDDGTEVHGWTIRIVHVGGYVEERHVFSDPAKTHTDTDSFSDKEEFDYGYDPSLIDTDKDGIWDDVEDWDQDGDVDRNANGDLTETSPISTDSDGDYLPDGWIDYDNDGVKELGEYEDSDQDRIYNAYFVVNGIDIFETNPMKRDTDGDKVIDGYEHGAVIFRTVDPSFKSNKNMVLMDYGTGSLELFTREARIYDDNGDTILDNSDTSWDDHLNNVVLKDAFKTPKVKLADGIWVGDYEIYFYEGSTIPYNEIFIKKSDTEYIKFKIDLTPPSTVDEKFYSNHHVWEYAMGTVVVRIASANNQDWDNDNVDDHDEIMVAAMYESNHLAWMDLDGDGLYNSFDPDSDGDGVTDCEDISVPDENSVFHYEPLLDLDADGYPNMLDPNSDGDYELDENGDYVLVNGEMVEWLDGVDQKPWSHNMEEDDDGDNIINLLEDLWGTSSELRDSDRDGIEDGRELFWNQDMDGDGVINALDIDSDGDGFVDGYDITVIGHYDYNPDTPYRSWTISINGVDHTSDPMTNDDGDTDYEWDNDFWSFITGEEVTTEGSVYSGNGLYLVIEDMLFNERLRDPYYLLTEVPYGYISSSLTREAYFMNEYNLDFEVKSNEWWFQDPDLNNYYIDLVKLDNGDYVVNGDTTMQNLYYDIYFRYLRKDMDDYIGYAKWGYEVVFRGEDRDCDGGLDTDETLPYDIDSDDDTLLDGRSILWYDSLTTPINPQLNDIPYQNVYFEYQYQNQNNPTIMKAKFFRGEDANCDGIFSSFESDPLDDSSDEDGIDDEAEVHQFYLYDRLGREDDFAKSTNWDRNKGQWGIIPEKGSDANFKHAEFFIIVAERNDYQISFRAHPGVDIVGAPQVSRTISIDIDRYYTGTGTSDHFHRVYDLNNPMDPMYATSDYTKRIRGAVPSDADEAELFQKELRSNQYSKDYEYNFLGNKIMIYSYNFNLLLEDLLPGTYRIRIENNAGADDIDNTLYISPVTVMKRGIEPGLTDTDGDTISDGDEINQPSPLVTSPFLADSDWDGVPDDVEKDDNIGTNPMSQDTDKDGIIDGLDKSAFTHVELDWSHMKPIGYDFLEEGYYKMLWLNGNSIERFTGEPCTFDSDLSEENVKRAIGEYCLYTLGDGWPKYEATSIVEEAPPGEISSIVHLGEETYFDDMFTYEFKYTTYKATIQNVWEVYDKDNLWHAQFQFPYQQGQSNHVELYIAFHPDDDLTGIGVEGSLNVKTNFAFMYRVYDNYVVDDDALSFLPEKYIIEDWAAGQLISSREDNPKCPYNVYKFTLEIPQELAKNTYTYEGDTKPAELNDDGWMGFDIVPVWVKCYWMDGSQDYDLVDIVNPDFRTFQIGALSSSFSYYGYAMMVHQQYAEKEKMEGFSDALDAKIASLMDTDDTDPNDNWHELVSNFYTVNIDHDGNPNNDPEIAVINYLNDDETARNWVISVLGPDGYNIVGGPSASSKNVYAIVVIEEDDGVAISRLNYIASQHTWSGVWSEIVDDGDTLEFRPPFDSHGDGEGERPAFDEFDNAHYGKPSVQESVGFNARAISATLREISFDSNFIPPKKVASYVFPLADCTNNFYKPKFAGWMAVNPAMGWNPYESMPDWKTFQTYVNADDVLDFTVGTDYSKIRKPDVRCLSRSWIKDGTHQILIEDFEHRQRLTKSFDINHQGTTTSNHKITYAIENQGKFRRITVYKIERFDPNLLAKARVGANVFLAGVDLYGGVATSGEAYISFRKGDTIEGVYKTAMATTSFAAFGVDAYEAYLILRTTSKAANFQGAAYVQLAVSIIELTYALYELTQAQSQLEFDARMDNVYIKALDVAVACCYFAGAAGPYVLEADMVCRGFTTLLMWCGCEKITHPWSLGELIYRWEQLLQGQTLEMDQLEALQFACDDLIVYYDDFSKNEPDPNIHWWVIFPDPA